MSKEELRENGIRIPKDATDTNVGDTISRQAALEKVRAMQAYKLFENDDMLLIDKAEVQTELMMLQAVQPEILACGSGELVAQPEPQWIPVSERLPEEYGEYLVTKRTIGGHCEEYDVNDIAYFDDDGFHKADRIIAWMPLPEAYKPNK